MRNLGGRVQNTLGPTNQAATNQIYTVKDIQNQRKLKSPKAQKKIKRNRLSNKSQCDQYNEFLAFKSLCFYLEVGLQPKRKPVTDDIFYTQLFFFKEKPHMHSALLFTSNVYLLRSTHNGPWSACKLFTILGKTLFPFGLNLIRNSVLPHSQQLDINFCCYIS